ncbi:nuclear transport factor 2 family protein [Flavobacteriales bacterium]|nr:nuclear transport factor 2 family protein [Flavobacteriales bacterium]
MKSFLPIMACVFLASCHNPTRPDMKAEEKIRLVLAEQQICWNKGDIDSFMDGYWNSDSLRFIGKSGINYGWQATLDNYKKSYPDKAAMGKLEFDILNLEPMGTENYLVTGKWKLIREADEPNGLFTLIWKRFGDEWKIIYDHSS